MPIGIVINHPDTASRVPLPEPLTPPKGIWASAPVVELLMLSHTSLDFIFEFYKPIHGD